MNWLREWLMGRWASPYAGDVDGLYMFITAITIFFFFFNGGLILYAVWRWRRKSENETTPHITHNTKLEILWSVVPLIVVVFIFFWGFKGYVTSTVAPTDAMEVVVTARKWNWAFEYSDGTRTLNSIHVPVNKPVKFIMQSEDVIHSFYVPAMRLKRDVLPGRYTELWFKPTAPGTYHIFCAEYCGKGHSDMSAKLIVDSPDQFESFLREGDEETRKMPLAELGRMVYENKGCATCHSLDGTRGQGPSFKGIWGTPQPCTDGKPRMVDENYIRESIMQPQAAIVMGYEPIMPTFQGLLRPREIDGIIAFIKTLQ